MFKKVSKAVASYGLIKREERIGIGLSGGADSVAMLDFLVENYPQNQWMALHFEHGIRGQAAIEDGEFCRALAEKYKIPFAIEHGDVPAYAKKHKMSLEAAARELRYRFFDQCMERYRLDKVALAHHREDQLETILWNIIRGCGAKGLTGMEPLRGRYIRPLMDVRKEDILAYLQQKNLCYREDATNLDMSYSRNYLRHQVIPKLKHLNPGVEDAILGLSCRIKGQTELLMEYLQEDYEQCVTEEHEKIVVSLPKFMLLKTPAQQLILRRALEQVFTLKDVEAKHIKALLELAGRGKTGKQLSLKGRIIAQVIYDTLVMQRPQQTSYWEMAVDLSSTANYKDGICLQVHKVPSPSQFPPKNSLVQYVDGRALKESRPLCLRNRKEGDVFTAFGGGTKKLKDYLINQKIPRAKRDTMLLLCTGSQVLWAVGLQLGEKLRVRPDSKEILQLEIQLPSTK